MRTIYLFFRTAPVLGLSLLLCAAGCADRLFRTLEARLAESTEFVERDARSSSGSPWEKEKAACILAQLRSATVASLRKPTACCAEMFFTNAGNTVAIVVYWIEDQPTPDGVRFLVGPNSKPIDGVIWKPYADQNEKAARTGVLFSGGPNFPVGSEQVAALWKEAEVTVILTKDGQRVSNTVPLHRMRPRRGGK